ncbi:MAG: 1-acyl-sn-glycerol-3-phosphate acyltransferase, partial [Alphaproteobacteria bacterium]
APQPVASEFRITSDEIGFGVSADGALSNLAARVPSPDVRYFVSAGAAFDPAVARDLNRFGFDIIQAYGLTESTGAATVTPPSVNRLGTVGRALPGIDVEVRAPDGAVCRPGEEGEIVLRGPTLTPGYYGRPDATAAVIRDGWFHTGDLGVLDADGHLRVTGRSKDVVVLGSGKKVFPEEVERELERSPFVKEVCVLGVREPGRALSETLHAVVVPDMEALRRAGVVNVRQYLRNEIETLSARLPPHQRIMGFDVSLEDLPRTTTRKVKRFVVLKNLAALQASTDAASARRDWTEADRAWAAAPGPAAIFALLRANAPAAPADIHPDDSLELDLGFDSLGRIELLVSIEQATGRRLDDTARVSVYTVRDLVDAAGGADAASGVAAAGVAWPAILDSDEAARLPRGAGPGMNAARFVVLRAIRGLAALLLRLDRRGLEHLPAGGPFILAVNHQSYLDTFLLLSALPYATVRRTLLLGKTKFFSGGVVGWFSGRLNITVVDADSNLVQAMRASARVLREGRSLLLFPEGERSIDGEIKPLRRGAAILACHLGVPVVPVVLDGPYAIWPRGRRFQRLAPVSIRILPPMVPPAAEQGAVAVPLDLRAEAMTRDLEARMAATLAALRTRSDA